MILDHQSSPYIINQQAGGKAKNLFELSNLEFDVPNWFVIPSSTFLKFKEQHGVEEYINSLMNQGLSFIEMEKKIEEYFLSLSLPHLLEDEILTAKKRFNQSPIAVRSSALDEDSSSHSFAGQLSTFLNIISDEEALISLKKCWASAYSERALSYRKRNELSLSKIEVAVIFQEMVASEKSGVTFTANPVTGDAKVLMINVIRGLGEALVSGEVDAETIEIIKKDRSIKSQTLIEERSLLTDDELLKLIISAKKIEEHYKVPQDIEWAFASGKLSILQARPITTTYDQENGELFIWDNSNIVESYGGLTLPLTFDFAHYVYHQVYVQFCEILYVPKIEISKMDYFLKNMLGLIYGRVYYNILNWYKLTSILPGFKYNREFMETMMGTSNSLADEIAEKIKRPISEQSFREKCRGVVTGFKFFYFHLRIQSIVDNFLHYFHKNHNKFKKIDFKRLTSHEILAHYYQLEQIFLKEWKAPIINDYLCMVHFGLLKKLTAIWLKNLGETFINDIMCGDGHFESAAPSRELTKIAIYIQNSPTLISLFKTSTSLELLEFVHRSRDQELTKLINNYLDLYGHRSMSEMKLEQQDLHQNPLPIFVYLKNMLQKHIEPLDENLTKEREIRTRAEKKAKDSLTFVQSIIYFWSLKNARQAVRNRENTRFCRTRIYGVVRAMFFAIGEEWATKGIIHKDSDLFYLRLHELKGLLEGTMPQTNLKALIDLRKNEYETFSKLDPISRCYTKGPVYFHNSRIFPKDEMVHDKTLLTNQLKGTPCSPGIVEGVVKVIIDPTDNLELDGQILVTIRTDPGWVPLFSSISALLVERGGLLSHSAIVAREMGIPAIVSIPQLTKKLTTGMRIRMNGETGLIEILDEDKK